MKVRVYLRVARNPQGRTSFKCDAGVRANYKPLTKRTGNWNEEAIPTAAFALDLDIPDEVFTRAEQVLAEIEIPEDKAKIAVEVGEAA